MRKVALLYNPLSGRRTARRLADIEAVLTVLRNAGVEASASPTRGSAETADQVRQAMAEGCDTIFACGGDGTVHDIVQGLTSTQTALAIIPMGTANVLAHDLGLALSPPDAARAALTAKPRRVTVGRVSYRDASGNSAARYFVATVGIGMDAYLFHTLDPAGKRRFGMLAYCGKAALLWLTHAIERFRVSVPGTDDPAGPVSVTQLLAVRISNFGGVLRELAPGASLERDDLRLVLFRTSSRWAYLAYILRGLVGAKWGVPGVDLIYSSGATCEIAAETLPVYVEADGEILGTLPAEISIVRQALTILVASRAVFEDRRRGMTDDGGATGVLDPQTTDLEGWSRLSLRRAARGLMN
jgi:diacylglycerol kinase (ATP)